MTDVLINGTTYVPAGQESPIIGIGITTRNRPEQLTQTLANIRKHTPKTVKIVVVDDASDNPVAEADYRFSTQAGIARAKNKTIELLYNAGVQHLFLLDDDCWPVADNWWKPYVDSPEPSLMYLFKDVAGGRYLNTPATILEDGQHVAYTHPRGCALYVNRDVVERVGGMRPQFGIWGNEHVEYSTRIHNAGLTTCKFMDVTGSKDLWYSMDEHSSDHQGFKRSVPDNVRQEYLVRNEALFEQYKDSTDFVEFREQQDVVITSLFTGVSDHQRGTSLPADPNVLSEWATSVPGSKIVLHNEPLEHMFGCEYVQVVCSLPVYFQRWVSTYQWLREHPEVRFVWCTDGTDVIMLREPWEHMMPGRLYVGHEATVVGCEWMLSNHQAPHLQEFMAQNTSRTLLNAGVVGGDRDTVMSFVHSIVKDYFAHADTSTALDMGTFNFVAYRDWADQLVFGPQVATVFKSYDTGNKHAWWCHK